MSSAPSTPRRKIHLAHQTFIDLPPPALVAVAAQAGYDGVTLRLRPARAAQGEPPYPMLEAGAPMMAETLARLADTGLVVQSIEVVRIGPALDLGSLGPLFEAGARLQAVSLNVISDDADEQRTVDTLAQLAEQAARWSMGVGFEFIVYTGIRTWQQALRVIDASGTDTRLTVDALHLHRSGGTPQQLRGVPAHRFGSLQLCDAMHEPLPDSGGVPFEAVAHRLLPTEGELPLRELLQVLPSHLDIELEAPVKSLRARHSELQIAQRALALTQQLLAQVAAPAAAA